MTKVKVSPKNEFLLPKAVMEAHGFADGAEVEVSGGVDQIVLKLVRNKQVADPKRRLTVDEFIARLPRFNEPLITDEMINETIVKEARRMWDEENKH